MRHRCPFGGLIDLSAISRSPDGLLRPAQSFLPERLRELRLRRQPPMNLDCALLHGSVKLTGAAGPCQNGNLSPAAHRCRSSWLRRFSRTGGIAPIENGGALLERRPTAGYFFSVRIQQTSVQSAPSIAASSAASE